MPRKVNDWLRPSGTKELESGLWLPLWGKSSPWFCRCNWWGCVNSSWSYGMLWKACSSAATSVAQATLWQDLHSESTTVAVDGALAAASWNDDSTMIRRWLDEFVLRPRAWQEDSWAKSRWRRRERSPFWPFWSLGDLGILNTWQIPEVTASEWTKSGRAGLGTPHQSRWRSWVRSWVLHLCTSWITVDSVDRGSIYQSKATYVCNNCPN